MASGAILASVATADGPPARSFIRSAGPIDAARTLIVINGGPGYDSQQTFRGLRGLASSSRRVVAYDQRGVGRTTAPISATGLVDYTLDAFVADLEALRVRLHVDKIDLLGHSFGALVAAAYAAVHPDRVRSLVLASGLPMSVKAQSEGDARFAARLAQLQRRRIVPRAIPFSCAQSDDVLLPVYLGNPKRVREIRGRLGPFRCDDGVGSEVNDSILRDPRRHQLELALARYRGPALVIIGARDPFGAAWVDDNAAPLIHARLTKRVLRNAGHMIWLESPAFLPTVRTFLGPAA
jgi:proline iminopeptidase